MNSPPDLELAKKSYEKARQLFQTNRFLTLALLGICVTTTGMAFVFGSMYGYKLAQLQLAQQNQAKTVIVQGSYIETDYTTIKHKMPEKLAQQLEKKKIEENQTTISTTTSSTTTTTDEDLIKISISFDTEINEDDPKSENQAADKIWNEILDTLGKPETEDAVDQQASTTTTTTTTTEFPCSPAHLCFDGDSSEDEPEPRKETYGSMFLDESSEEVDDDTVVNQPISTTTTKPEVLSKTESGRANFYDKMGGWDMGYGIEEDSETDPTQTISSTTNKPEDLTSTEFDYESILNSVLESVNHELTKDYDHLTMITEDEDLDQDLDLDKNPDQDQDQEVNNYLDEDLDQNPKKRNPEHNSHDLFDLEFRTKKPSTPVSNIQDKFTEYYAIKDQYEQAYYHIYGCPAALSAHCSAEPVRKEINSQRLELKQIWQHLPSLSFKDYNETQVELTKAKLTAAIAKLSDTRLDLCSEGDTRCQVCVHREANCHYTIGRICNTQTEWSIIKFQPKKLRPWQCLADRFQSSLDD